MESMSRIFLIEDDPAVRDALIIFLEVHGYSIEAFDSSEEFLQKINETRHGVLILDIRLPGMSGIELQAELKNRKIDLPVIFITGHGDDEVRKLVMQEGIAEFLDKPIDHDALLRCIDRNLTGNTQ